MGETSAEFAVLTDEHLARNVVSMTLSAWRKGLLVTGEGKPRKALTNVVETLLRHPKWSVAPLGSILRFNAFTNAIETTARPPWPGEVVEPGEWSEADDVRAVCWLERELGPTFAAASVRSAADNVARRSTYHPVREWLRSLRWDGVMRLDGWLARYLGATSQPAEYLARVGRWWLVSAVARAERPGCQADHLLVLEGPQGAGKSSAVRALGAPWTSTLTAALGDKDAYQALRGKWILELAELAGMRRSDAERVKAFVSSPVDTYRPSYGRAAADFPRQCVFVGTTNASTYLVDASGGRRFWPVRVGAIDLESLQSDREQLWAEAVARYDSGEPWWPAAADVPELADEQDDRAEVDPWEERIASWLERPGRVDVSSHDVLTECLDKRPGDLQRNDEMRVGAILTRLGWARKRRRVGGAREYRFVREGSE